MTNTAPADLPASEVCPGPPEAPYTALGAWPHGWVPLAVAPGRPVQEAGPEIGVLEACPTCRQWRPIGYTRLDQSPRIPG